MARFFGLKWTHFGLAAQRQRAKDQRTVRPAVEGLEDRTLPSITIDAAGLVSVIGTPHHDEFVIRVDPTLATQLQFSDDGGTTFTSFAGKTVTGVDVQGLNAHDVLTIDNSFGLVGGAVRSEACLNNAPVHPQCGAVRRGRQRAAHIGHQTRDFVGIYEPLEQRRRPHRLEKLLLEFRERFAPA
jgi:hypothetical protein